VTALQIANSLFDLAAISDERFQKKDMPRLFAALGIPDIIALSNGQRLPEMEALCILLRRLIQTASLTWPGYFGAQHQRCHARSTTWRTGCTSNTSDCCIGIASASTPM
jgi:hypothetical protein